MDELAKLLSTLTVGGAGVWTGVLMFAGWWLKEWRETRKLSNDDRNARREGYAKQVAALMAENRSLGSDMALLREQHDKYRQACDKETTELRDHIVRLEDRLTGFRRTFATLEISLARFIARMSLGEQVPHETLSSLSAILDRLKTDDAEMMQ